MRTYVRACLCVFVILVVTLSKHTFVWLMCHKYLVPLISRNSLTTYTVAGKEAIRMIESQRTKTVFGSHRASLLFSMIRTPVGGSRGGGGGAGGPDPTPENHKNLGFLSNTGPDPLKNHKATMQHSMLGHHRPTSVSPFKWLFAGGPIMAYL